MREVESEQLLAVVGGESFVRQVGVVFVASFVEQRLRFGERANTFAVVALDAESSGFHRSDIGAAQQRQRVRPNRGNLG
ncbi:hypothetical protein ACFO5K_19790 [Nocardia halotolerans]|uniref:Uncharacterized protein n=1 Tax=Nocardia halotolerans TaxID=1755878 RepID=A0ABV8VLX7_9NOCA